ncbi:sigma-70 factor, region 1.1 family protein [Burkholderia cepacia]|nr:sigma-70 factor, region 1.1 family protein [Burkholderia cepacia]
MQSSLDPGRGREHDSVPRGGTNAERTDRLNALVALGIGRGYVTRGEIVDALPDDAADGTDFDAAASMLGEWGIEVREHVDSRSAWTLDRHFARAADTTSPLADASALLATADLLAARTSDPVRIYLREMSATPLLDREEEIALALHLESGRAACIDALSRDPAALDAVASIAGDIRAGRVAASVYVTGFVGDAESLDEARATLPGESPANATAPDSTVAPPEGTRTRTARRTAPHGATASSHRSTAPARWPPGCSTHCAPAVSRRPVTGRCFARPPRRPAGSASPHARSNASGTRFETVRRKHASSRSASSTSWPNRASAPIRRAVTSSCRATTCAHG